MIVTEKKLDDIDKQIIKLSKEGQSAKEVAAKMGVSSYIVSNRIKEMMQYFNCKNKVELVDKISNLVE